MTPKGRLLIHVSYKKEGKNRGQKLAAYKKDGKTKYKEL